MHFLKNAMSSKVFGSSYRVVLYRKLSCIHRNVEKMQIVVLKLIPCVWLHSLTHSGVIVWLLWYLQNTNCHIPSW